MRFAVISDIHGNRLALEAVLADIAGQGVDSTINLGDVVSGPLDPKGTIELLGELDFATIKGNHERWTADRTPDEREPIDDFAARQLDAASLRWLSKLPANMSIGDDVFMCHGTPTSDTEPWLDSWAKGRNIDLPDEAQVMKHAAGVHFPVILCGHTHIQRVARLSDGRLIVNPGAVGIQFLYGAPDARYALIDRNTAGRWSVTLRVVPYDWEGAAKMAEANGFPLWRPALVGGWVGPERMWDIARVVM